jgi:hypothetical protein
LQFIRQTFLDNGLDSLFFTSDNGFGGDGMGGTLPGVLQTANFQNNPDGLFNRLLEIQPDMPIMAMEFWSGWSLLQTFFNFSNYNASVKNLKY